MNLINQLALQAEAALTFVRMDNLEDGTEMQFRLKIGRRHYQGRIHDFFAALGECKDVVSIRTDCKL